MNASKPSPGERPDAIERTQKIVRALDEGMTYRDIERALEDMKMIDQTIDPQLHYLVTDVITKLHQELGRISTVD